MNASAKTDAGLDARRLARHRARQRTNAVALFLALAAMAFGVFWLVWILFETVRMGMGGLALSTFTQMTPAPQSEGGGLANALFGSLLMVGLATLMGTPVGVMAGIYLAEYGRKGWLGASTRFINDILLSAPSIVIGLFIYSLVVAPLKSYSGFAGALALAVLMLPVVVRTTESAVRLVPGSLREAGLALGLSRRRVALQLVLPAAIPGVITGALLAVARAAGETAPMLFTALGNTFITLNPADKMSALPLIVFKDALQPYPQLVTNAWGAALVLVLLTLIVNVASRLALRRQIQLAGRF